jgi:hypothetical protein
MSPPPPPDGRHDPRRRTRLGGTGGTNVWRDRQGGRDVVVKDAPAVRAGREAQVLALLAGTGVAPALVRGEPGRVTAEYVGGGTRPAWAWTPGDAGAVGALLSRVHRVAPGAGPLGPHPDVGAIGHVAGIREALGSDRDALVTRALAVAPDPGASARALLHGDPWSGNIIWAPSGPVLVDWEYARLGDPAEDVAYLAAMDALRVDTLDAVLAGYCGSNDAFAVRVRRWCPLTALWCAAWSAHRDPARSARLAARAAQVIDVAERA